ncbi:thermonuclease family protein [Microcoleus sp. B7-D4]|uniref:thermonuclease family protein n=1 Tax=Microcoleus sp. B7-D4 TaxID=2818696 RepID=UPI002FD3FEE8
MILAQAVSAQVINAQIVNIEDGDTLTVRSNKGQNITVRLSCIDAPEKNQEGGKEAYNRLNTLLPKGTSIKLYPAYKGLYEHQLLVVLVVFDKKNINLQMVQEGQAWVYENYIGVGRCSTIVKELRQGQATAQHQRIGLWNKNNPCPPWDYRKNQCK